MSQLLDSNWETGLTIGGSQKWNSWYVIRNYHSEEKMEAKINGQVILWSLKDCEKNTVYLSVKE